jgi:glycerol uptake operon antiterminator
MLLNLYISLHCREVGPIIEVLERLKDNPVIAAVRSTEDMKAALDSEATTIFLLNSDIFNLKQLVDEVKGRGKSAFIHVDFVEGLGSDSKAVDYLAEIIQPDGIISTRGNLIRHARDRGMFTIQRFFLIDSLSYHTTIRQVQSVKPDMIEVLPGVMPGVIGRICRDVSMPVIAGGLIDSKQDIIEILKAGAMGASTGKTALWNL